MTHGAAVWRPVVKPSPFYPAMSESTREDSVCLESRKYGKFKPEER